MNGDWAETGPAESVRSADRDFVSGFRWIGRSLRSGACLGGIPRLDRWCRHAPCRALGQRGVSVGGRVCQGIVRSTESVSGRRERANVPAVGYRVDVGDRNIAFSTDQNGSNPAWADLASGVNLLVAHVAVPETVGGLGASLHAKPSVWGRMATDADVGTLLLSHLSRVAPRDPSTTGDDLPEITDRLSFVRSTYNGPLLIAEDLMCVPLTDTP